MRGAWKKRKTFGGPRGRSWICREPGDTVIDDLHHMPGASWFPDGRVSFAGTILREADDRPAIRARGEHQSQWHHHSA